MNKTTTTETEKETLTEATTETKKETKYISDLVMARVSAMKLDGSLVLPSDYAVGNNLRTAYIMLHDIKGKDAKPVLEGGCTPHSIANALLEMVTKNLSVSKKQAYFIPRGDKLCLDVSYFGNIALAKRHGLKRDPDASIIYKDDIFIYEIVKGKINILKHEQKLENIDLNNIVGAYAVGELEDGTIKTVIKTLSQIKTAWGMGGSKGNSAAHNKFPDQMAMKTVINSLCKTINSASDDGYLFDETNSDSNELDIEAIKNKRQAIIDETNTDPEETIYEEVNADATIQPEQAQTPEPEQPFPKAKPKAKPENKQMPISSF